MKKLNDSAWENFTWYNALEHIKLFKNDILILENLTNLEKLINIERFDIFAFPLKIRAEASLVRAVAKIY